MFISSIRFFLAASFLIFPVIATPMTGDDAPQSAPVWFALSDGGNGKLTLEPFGQIAKGKLNAMPDACKADPQFRRFEETYLKPGITYEVRFGGAASGKITVDTPVNDGGTYEVTYSGPAKIHGRTMALATNVPEISGRENKRQALSTSERDAAINLAKELFQQAGIPETALKKLVVGNLTKTIFEPSTDPSFIGSFTLEEPEVNNVRYNSLFFVAHYSGGQLVPELSELHLSLSDTDSQTLVYVEQADMFDAGQDNVVLQLNFGENYRYRVYGRAKDGKHWERNFETQTLGCL